MRRSLVALVPTALALLIAACSGDRDTTAPRTIAPTRSSNTLTIAPVCSFNNVKADFRGFFASSTDVAGDFIATMSRATEPTKTSIGWRVIYEVTAARLTGRQKLPYATTVNAGESLIKNLFACMDGVSKPISVTADGTPINDGELAAALYAGIIEVRGGPGYPTGFNYPTEGAYGKLFNGSKQLGQPRYGVDNQSGNANWAANPFLIVGVPITGSSYLTFATNINTNGDAALGNGPKPGFELFTIPVSQSKTGYVIGVCIPVVQSSQANLLVHAGNLAKHVSPSTGFCTNPVQASLWNRLTGQLASLFTVKPLYAEFETLLGFAGGGPSDWSPNFVGQVSAGNVHLAFTAQSPIIANIYGSTSGNTVVHFEVTATIDETKSDNTVVQHPVPNVDVSIAISGNNGTPGTIVGTSQVTTNGNGVASFDVEFTKAGGFYVTATGSLAGGTTGSALSQQFWIRNQ